MATDLKPHEKRIDQLIDEAITSVADDVLASEGLHSESDVGLRRHLEIYADIQNYVANKINEDFRQRRIKKLVNNVHKTIKMYLDCERTKYIGSITFTCKEEADEASRIFCSKAYEPETVEDEDGFYVVKYRQLGYDPK